MIKKCILIILVLVNIILLIELLVNSKTIDKFIDGYGRSFSDFFNPLPLCTSEKDCYKGFTSRGLTYQNMCEPEIINIPGIEIGRTFNDPNRLLKTKVQTKDSCVKIL